MLSREQELFQSVKSLEYVCYRDSEATDDELKRLLRELPGAGVALIELDAGQTSPKPESTLLLAGTVQTLVLAGETQMATVGFGSVLSLIHI